MTDERLEEIREQHRRHQYVADPAGELIAEIDRLRAENARLHDPARLGDVNSQASTFAAIWRLCEERGLLSFWCDDMRGRTRILEFLRSRLPPPRGLWRGPLADWLRDGPRLVRQGVERVEITDRSPKKHEQPGGLCHWHWVGCDLGTAPPYLVYVAHPSEQAARDALSAACIAWAQGQEVQP